MDHTAAHSHGAQAHSADQRPHDHSHHDGADPDLAEILDLDARLFAQQLTASTGRIARLAGDDIRYVVDLGAGTGTGTFALLERFPSAKVTAIDNSPSMLAQLVETAQAKGLRDRVRTLEADADAGLSGVTNADLVWASASLHHLGDPAATLARIRAALRPGGLLAVAELDGMPRFLSDDAIVGHPGFEARCRQTLAGLHTDQVSHLDADWGALIAESGLIVELEHIENLRLNAPFPDGVGRYAHLVFSRTRSALDGRITPSDLAVLDDLLDGGPQDVRNRTDLTVQSTRQLWVARRPADDS